MINLIKNELIKIFSKKSIYVILIITILFMVLNSILVKVFENSMVYDPYNEENITYNEERLAILEKDIDKNKEEYIYTKSYLQIAELAKEYELDSWQFYIIENKVEPLLYNLLNTEPGDEYEKYETEYNELIKNIETKDWKYFAQEELNNVNEEIRIQEEFIKELEMQNDQQVNLAEINEVLQNLRDNKQILEWRLEKDISYGRSNLNEYLEQWISSKRAVNEYEKNIKSKTPTYLEKYENQQNIEILKLCEYAITNGINEKISNQLYIIDDNAKTELLNVFDNYALFIIITIVMIAGTIVSEEFNKGTIKLLLVRPYKRIKILFAKFISCLIILAMILIIITLMQTIIGGFTYGFNSYSTNISIYNFKTGNVEIIGAIKYIVMIALTKLPKYILLMTLAFTVGVLFNNSALAITLPLLGYMGADLINQLAYTFEKAKFLMYFVTPNWDLSIYLFGRLPQFEPITAPFSILICLIYFIIMLYVSQLVFRKRDIKNI